MLLTGTKAEQIAKSGKKLIVRRKKEAEHGMTAVNLHFMNPR